MTDEIHKNEAPAGSSGGREDAFSSDVRGQAQVEYSPSPPLLHVDREEIASFMRPILRNVRGDFSARGFRDQKTPLFQGRWNDRPKDVRFAHEHPVIELTDDPGSLEAAIDLVTFVAKDCAAYSGTAVCSPVWATLQRDATASPTNALCVPAVFADLDATPAAGRKFLEDKLGPPGFVVESGSTFIDRETGEIEKKVHLWWPLEDVANTPAQVALAIRIMKEIARRTPGADRTMTITHPLAAPWTWNTKARFAPVLRRVVEERVVGLDLAAAERAFLGTAAPRRKKPAPQPQETPQAAFNFADAAQADTSDAALIGALLRGENYHAALVALAFRNISRGLTVEETIAVLRAYMNAVPEALRDGGEAGRWQARYDDIERIVGSAPEAVARKRSDDAGGPDMTLLHPERSPAVALPADLLKPLQKGGTNALEAWVLAAAEAKGAPLDYVVVTTLAVVASVLSGVDVEVWPEFREPLIIWAALVGDPSSNKSPGMAPALEALEDLERDLRSAALAEYGRWLEDKKAAEKAGEEFDEPPPVIPRLTVSDVTVESLCEQIAKQGRGVAYALDELAALLGNFSRYSGGTDRPFWVKAHGGKQHPILRLSREASDVPRAAVSVVGAIQPAKLYELLLRTADDGLTSRFVFAYPDPAPVKRPTKWPDRTLMKGALEKLYEIGSGLTLRFDDEAKDVIDSVRLWVRQEEVKSEGLIKGTIGKASGLVVRVAGVLTLLDWAISGGPVPTTVGKLATERARVFVQDYVVPMARRVIGETASPGETRGARRLARLIVEGVPQRETINIREIQKRERTHLQTSAEIEAAIDVLVQGRWLTLESGKPGPKGGRPLHVWRVNPDVFRRAAGVSSGYAGFAGPGVGGEQ
jgi:hypothetical protein